MCHPVSTKLSLPGVITQGEISERVVAVAVAGRERESHHTRFSRPSPYDAQGKVVEVHQYAWIMYAQALGHEGHRSLVNQSLEFSSYPKVVSHCGQVPSWCDSPGFPHRRSIPLEFSSYLKCAIDRLTMSSATFLCILVGCCAAE